MKFHWMISADSEDIDGLKNISNIVNNSGYYSMLLTYHSLKNDSWIKCANIIDKTHKFKYMMAIRTYAISPEYFAMMFNAFEEIQKDRIMFNIVSGDIQKSEKSVHDMIDPEILKNSQDRINYTDLWMEKFLSLDILKNKPEIAMSGVSKKTIDVSNKYSKYHICMLSEFKNGLLNNYNNNKMICLAMVIRDSFEEAENFAKNFLDENHQINWTIYGTEIDIVNELKILYNSGVKDILIRRHRKDDQSIKIHNLIKKINDGEYSVK